MRYSPTLFATFLALFTVCSPLCRSEEMPSEEQRRTQFLAEFNGLRADKRLAALNTLRDAKEQRSIEALYFVSWRDTDPEVRSRAFSIMVCCEDTYGYIAQLAADSFKCEKDLGVKVEKAVAMSALQYKWAALNELAGFVRTLRWNDGNWSWSGQGRSAGYVASGNPAGGSGELDRTKSSGGGYDVPRNREPLRWRNEEELIGIIAGSINRLSGTRIESRPRIDQEIVKWWERKSDLWAEYDRELRAKTLAMSREQPKDDRAVQPAKDTLRDLLAESNTIGPAKEAKPVVREKARRLANDEEE